MEKLSVPSLTFHTGNKIPIVGFGTWRLWKEECIEAIKCAILKAGYRHIDTATFYDNHEAIGTALAEIFQTSNLKREDIFVTSKISSKSQGYEKALEEAEKIFKDIKLDYLDLLLIHNPAVEGYKANDPEALEIRSGTWKALEKLKDDGRVKDIGVSNFLPEHFLSLYKTCKHKPVINQIEIHPLCFDEEIITFCKNNNVVIQAYSSLAKGRTNLMTIEEVIQIAKDHNKTPAQVCLKWGVQHGFVIIPKSQNEGRMIENIDLFSWDLTEDDMKKLAELNVGKRVVTDPRNL